MRTSGAGRGTGSARTLLMRPGRRIRGGSRWRGADSAGSMYVKQAAAFGEGRSPDLGDLFASFTAVAEAECCLVAGEDFHPAREQPEAEAVAIVDAAEGVGGPLG